MKKNKKVLISIILILILVVIIIGVVLFNDKKNNQKETGVTVLELLTPLEKKDSVVAVKQTKENIVRVINKVDDKKTIYGTGFFDKSGYLITNSHVVDIKGEISIQYNDGTISDATIYSNDILSDLALLHVEDVKVKALPIESTLNLEVTNELYSIGYQLNLEGEATVTKGILSAKRVASGIEFLQTDAPVNSGGSGGPVINELGQVLGIVTLASDNATLSFAISGDTLNLYIEKLINNKKINYVTTERKTNALNSVLKEVNYIDDDIYDEKEFLTSINEKVEEDKDNVVDNKEESDKKENHKLDNQKDKNKNNSNSSSNKKEPQEKSYIIISNDKEINFKEELPTDINFYFRLDKDLTNCKLDTSKVNMQVGGEYPVTVTCDQNKLTDNITVIGTVPPNDVVIPEIVMDETKSNVTSYEQVKGYWYYPGYRDACIEIKHSVDSYEFGGYTFDQHRGKLSYNYGGAGIVDEFSQLLEQVDFWVEGDYLVVTIAGKSYTMTRKPGVGVYNEEHYISRGWCGIK